MYFSNSKPPEYGFLKYFYIRKIHKINTKTKFYSSNFSERRLIFINLYHNNLYGSENQNESNLKITFLNSVATPLLKRVCNKNNTIL